MAFCSLQGHSRRYAYKDRVPEHGLCRSLALEVGAKDFLLDIPGKATLLQRWFMELGLLHQDPQAEEPDLSSLTIGTPLTEAATLETIASIQWD